MQNRDGIIAYIGVGSNLGDREANIRLAVELLTNTPPIEVRRVSKLLDNPAVGGPGESPRFLNAAIEVRTTLRAQDLLQRLLEIEQTMGRTRQVKWGPRLIDLDLLLYGDSIFRTESLTVPHPLMHERLFVLGPLAEIAPDAMHPVLQESIATLLARLTGSQHSDLKP